MHERGMKEKRKRKKNKESERYIIKKESNKHEIGVKTERTRKKYFLYIIYKCS